MRRIYEAEAYGDAPIANSYWCTTVTAPDWAAAEGDLTCDFAVIGAGYTGLNAALALAKAGADVVVLDAKTPGWGASGRNGGFCCLGGAKAGPKALERRFGAEAEVFFQAERAAVDHVARLLDTHGIDADTHSDGETLLAHAPREVTGLQVEAGRIRAIYGLEPELLPGEALAERGMNAIGLHGALTTPIGFALNPMKYVLGLAEAAKEAGARIFARSPVESISAAADGHLFTTPRACVTAKTLILATNGYSSDDLPPWLAARYLPIQSNILVSRMMSDAELSRQGWTSHQMSHDTRHLSHYFRLLPDKRMMFGMRGSTRSSTRAYDAARKAIRRDFDHMFPAWAGVETPHFWTGLLAFSANLVPFVGAVPGMDRTFASLCYHGNGVAMGSYAGARIADLALGRAAGGPFPAFLQTPPRRFPLGRLRRAVLPLAYRWYAFQDGA